MPTITVTVVLINSSTATIRWVDDGRPHGFWTQPLYPSNVKELRPGQMAMWRQESGGIATGVEGWAKFEADVTAKTNTPDRGASLELSWDRPFFLLPTQDIDKNFKVFNHDPDYQAFYPVDHGLHYFPTNDINQLQNIPLYVGFPFTGLAAPLFMYNENVIDEHVCWVVELGGSDQEATLPGLPLKVAMPVELYAVTLKVEPAFVPDSGAVIPASGGDLLWYQHMGAQNGSFDWTDYNGRKVGHGWGDFVQLFPGGNGIIYAVDPATDAVQSVGGTTTGIGGKLWWYKHLGHADGTFKWAPRQQVGIGWAGFEHVFSNGDGIIYAVDPIGQETIQSAIDTTHDVGGNLWWYKHLGYKDGSFKWEERKRVASNWGGFAHIFGGGDGIIYAVDKVVEPRLLKDGGTTPMTGGNLWWYRHTGYKNGTPQWEGPKKVGVGWGGFKKLFSAGEGLIYAIDGKGDLLWFRHEGYQNGSFKWTDNRARKVGTGWEIESVFAG